jgi:acyl-coenzyme A thioesterase PaaI-like protein
VDAAVRSEAPTEALRQAALEVRKLTEPLTERLRAPERPPSVDDLVTGVRMFNPVIGQGNPIAPPVGFEADGDFVKGRFTLGAAHEGPHMFSHGGISAMLLDQALGHAAAAAGNVGVTTDLSVRYRRPVPLGVPLLVWARVRDLADDRTLANGAIATVAEPDLALVTADPPADLGDVHLHHHGRGHRQADFLHRPLTGEHRVDEHRRHVRCSFEHGPRVSRQPILDTGKHRQAARLDPVFLAASQTPQPRELGQRLGEQPQALLLAQDHEAVRVACHCCSPHRRARHGVTDPRGTAVPKVPKPQGRTRGTIVPHGPGPPALLGGRLRLFHGSSTWETTGACDAPCTTTPTSRSRSRLSNSAADATEPSTRKRTRDAGASM